MPDRNWPPLHRHLGRVVGVAAYGCVAGTGAAVLLSPPEWASVAAMVTVLGLAGLALVSGATSAAAVALHNWHAEFVAVWFLAAATGGFAAVVWAANSSTAGSLLLTSIPLFCVLRGIQLWAFSYEARVARGRRVHLWRRSASREYHR